MSIEWNTELCIPACPEVAIIAVKMPADGDADEWTLLGELYRFDQRHQSWMGETSGLLLKHTEYRWTTETELLETLQ